MNIKQFIKGVLKIRAPALRVGNLNEKTRVEWLEKTLKIIPNGSRIITFQPQKYDRQTLQVF